MSHFNFLSKGEGRGEALNKKSLPVITRWLLYISELTGYNFPAIASLTPSLGTICSLNE